MKRTWHAAYVNSAPADETETETETESESAHDVDAAAMLAAD